MTTETQVPAVSSTTAAASAQQNGGTMEPAAADLSNVVRGTAENVLGKLEGDLQQAEELDEEELLQSTEPGPLGKDGRDVEDVLNVISQSIYREAEGETNNATVREYQLR